MSNKDKTMLVAPIGNDDVPISAARKRSNANLRPVKKGEKGRNPKGRPPGKSIKQLLREVNEADNRKLIKKMYTKGHAGDVRAAEWIARHADPAALEVVTEAFTFKLSHPDDTDD